jgi:Putative zinc-finger
MKSPKRWGFRWDPLVQRFPERGAGWPRCSNLLRPKPSDVPEVDMQHLDEGTIHAWLDGALAPDESRRVEEHAASCEACAALVAEARGLIAAASRILIALDDVPTGVIPVHAEGEAEVTDELATLRARKAAESLTRRRPRSRRPWLAAAAIVFVAVGTMTVLRRSTVDLTGKLDEATPVSSSVATPSPASVAPGPLVIPPAPSEKVPAEEQSGAGAAKIRKDESVAGQRKEAKHEAGFAARSAAPAASAADVERQEQRRKAPAPRQQQMPQAQLAQVQGGAQADAKRALAKVDSVQEASPDTTVRMKALSQARLDSFADSRNRRTAAIVDLFAGCYQIASPRRPSALPARIALDSTVIQHRADTVWYRARSLDEPVSPAVEYLWRVTGASSVDVIVKRDTSMVSARVTLPAVANVVATGAAGAVATPDLRLRAATTDVGLTATRLACRR